MTPSEVDFELLWGLIYLNLRVRSQPNVLGNEFRRLMRLSCHTGHKRKLNGLLIYCTRYDVWWNSLPDAWMFAKSKTKLKLAWPPLIS
jgi:hypothetical protein